jgi:hypothetical protein
VLSDERLLDTSYLKYDVIVSRAVPPWLLSSLFRLFCFHYFVDVYQSVHSGLPIWFRFVEAHTADHLVVDLRPGRQSKREARHG